MQQLDRLGKAIQVLETVAKANLATMASKIHKIVDDFNNTYDYSNREAHVPIKAGHPQNMSFSESSRDC